MKNAYYALFRQKWDNVYQFDLYRVTSDDRGTLVGTALVNTTEQECRIETWVDDEQEVSCLEKLTGKILKEAEMLKNKIFYKFSN